ncbi:MAG TPA: Lrp/AsnC family transcriptional regulator [Allosphingosinicella sp.]|nr:Lrp/AsnC family transcriptional regulator [Allosphingosinicella sp.]
MATMPNRSDLDTFDFELLKLMQQNNLLTAEQLAEKVALSPSAIARRLRSLRRMGAIQSDVSVVAPWVAGERLWALLHVYLERHAPRGGHEALRRHLLEAPEVQLFLEVSGVHDLVVLISVCDMGEFNDFADSMLADNPIVRRYETSFVKRTLKLTTAIPLDGPSNG